MTTYNYDDDNVIRRTGEKTVPVTFRTNRFFNRGSYWFFSTREGTNEGPYDSRVLAHEANQQYILKMQLSG